MAIITRRYVLVGPTDAMLDRYVDPTSTVSATYPTTTLDIDIDNTVADVVLTLDEYMTTLGFVFSATAPPGGPNPMALPEQWAVNSILPSQADIAMSAQVSTNFDDIKAIRAGSIVGLATRLVSAITAGNLTIEVTINGVGTGFLIAHSAGGNPSGGVVTQAVGADAYVAGDLIGLRFTTDAGFLPLLNNVEAWIEVVEVV